MKQKKENYDSFYQWMERCNDLGLTIIDDRHELYSILR
jgi:hypothetical protein